MTEIKYLIAVNIRLGDVKIASNKGYQERIEDVVKELVEDFISFDHVGQGGF